MTSGGIPVNHCQDVLNKQRTVVLRVHEKSIKALKCDRGGTDASSHVQERWDAQAQAFREADKQILAAQSAQYLWAPLTPADCRKGAPSRGHSDICSRGCRPARDPPEGVTAHLFSQSSPKSEIRS